MYLQRLELRGFKTFAPYTDFVFDEGITAIVGPNGSGKSNIADAVRWVLGEQSYVALRGKRTVDMIFAGTSRRPKLGMAEAVLTFDNSSRRLPLDFAEVTVTRRAYRSGENRYFVNGSRVRLREVLEILGKAGLGRRGFVVIGQGLVDAALSLRAEERRVLFEEAAGIHIHKDKRNDALRRLAETRQNILRVNDILNEIAPRMRALERQSKRAEEYQLLTHDLEQLLRIWYGHEWHHRQVALTEAEALLERRQDELDLGRGRAHELEALVSSSRQHQAELRRSLSAWHRESGELHAEAEVTTRELAVNRERLSLLRQHREEISTELTQLEQLRATAELEAEEARAAQESLQQQMTGRRQEAAQFRERWETAVASREDLDAQLESSRARVFALASTLSDSRNRSLQLQEQREAVMGERERQAEELGECERQLGENEERQADARLRVDQTLQAQLAAARRVQNLEGLLLGKQKALKEQDQELGGASRKLQRLRDRLELLQGLRQSLGGFAPAVTLLMQAEDRPTGIVGPVLSLLHVPKRVERAIESALGSYAQALVVDSLQVAHRAIDHLRGRAAGWAAFLPLDAIQAPALKKPPAAAGVVGMAYQLVDCESRYEKVVQLLLGNTVVVDDWDSAIQVRSVLAREQTVVTLAGEVLTATGVVGGGSARQTSLLAQEREWRELPDSVQAAEQEESAVREALRELDEQMAAAETELVAARAESERLSVEQLAAEQAQQELEQEHQRLEQEIDWHRRLDTQQARELAALEEKGTLLLQNSQRSEEEHTTQRQMLNERLAELESARELEEQARQALTGTETGLEVTRRQVQTQAELVSTQEANLLRLEGDIRAKTERAAELDGQVTTLETQVASLRTRSEELSSALAELAAKIEPAEAGLMAAESQILQLEKELTLARGRINELQTLFGQQLLERERRQDDLMALEQRIEDDLGDIEYPGERVQQLRLEFVGRGGQLAPPAQPIPENIGTDISDLKAQIRRLGSINPNAPREFREVRERFAFLQSQIEDLEESAESIQEVVKELDRLMKDEFLSVFKVAAKEFARYFEVLFAGGQARLRLTNPEDPATSGVEIFAQPPGRRPQPLAVLSGGERALTATALLFAVLKARPLPFCLLDEVDAMLDESNIGRFRSLLEEFAEQTQFIVITHNRGTIESADTIYGVSMGEEGVSQVVSLKLPTVQEIRSSPA
jgi:chromosome segregation protein